MAKNILQNTERESKMSISSINILGVTIKNRTKDETVETIKYFLSSDTPNMIFTPNAEIIYKASKNNNYKQVLNSASLLIPDGIGVSISMKILGLKSPQRMTGIEIAEEIIAYASRRNFRIFLLGGKPGIAEKAKEKIEAKYNVDLICGTSHGYFEKEENSTENQTIINKINQSGADIVFVCFGAPTQELWITQNASLLSKARVLMGLGGCLDVWSGSIPRAPRILRLLCLEWLFRAIKQPKRFKRIPNLFKFIFAVIRQERKKE